MDKDIREMFKEKNRVILINNLKYDLAKNIDSLLETFTNIFNLEFDTAIKKIISILEDSSMNNSGKFVTDSINRMKIENYEEIEKLLNIKKNLLSNEIDELEFEEEHLNNYYEMVFQTTKDFKKDFNEYIVNDLQEKWLSMFNEFVLKTVDTDKETLAVSRITDYLKNRLYGKLETKIHMELMLRDNNLINKAKESYLRFQDISSKTMRVSID